MCSCVLRNSFRSTWKPEFFWFPPLRLRCLHRLLHTATEFPRTQILVAIPTRTSLCTSELALTWCDADEILNGKERLMKGDFSRIRFEKTKHYTAVLEQQGRVAVDADHNEQRAIDRNLRETETVDIIGPYGGPQGDEGFAITTSANTIQIGAGRYYVQGILCENEAPLTYASQPYLISPAVSDSDLLSKLSDGVIDSIRLFLQVWQRLVTTLDDPCLREPALGQADTTVRVQTVWRVIAQTPRVRRSLPVGRSSPAIPANECF